MNEVVTLQQTEFSDFEALQDAVQDGNLDNVQLEQGTMAVSLTHLSVGSIGISTGSFSRGLRSRGILSGSRWMLGMMLRSDAPALWHQGATPPGDLIVIKPGQDVYARYTGTNSYASVLIEPDELFAFIESQQPGAAEAVVWRQSATVMASARPAAAVKEMSVLLAVLI